MAKIEQTIIERAMAKAIELADENETPFGAVLLDEHGIIRYSAANSGAADGPTAHAEMNVLRQASTEHGTLPNFHLVTTCEPCPMCMGAAIWCRVRSVHYGLSIERAAHYLPQIRINATMLAKASFHAPTLQGGVLEHEVAALFDRHK